MNAFKKLFKPLALAASLTLIPVVATAMTVSPDITPVGANKKYDYNTLVSDDFTDIDLVGGGGINLADALISLVEFTADGSGSLTIRTYVDPFNPDGIGASDLLLGLHGPLPAMSATVSWGGGPVVDLSDGSEKFISTIFTDAGAVGAQDLVFRWTDVASLQFSAQIAAVPLPASGLLLLTTMGGLAFVRRRAS